MPIDANKLRKNFLKFFELKGCKALPSSSLQPPDASTLFTSAGMHQFKDDFMGNLVHGTRAATTVQKCMRTPDLENVGKTARHHTFFEMLGFFSFGDKLKGPDGSTGFFKSEAIRWIWEFYTSKEWCGLDVSKLYVSVYGGDETGAGKDEEAANIWREVLGTHWPKAEIEKRIFWLGEHDNFWPAGAPSQGPNGVCGPCSEIFYDLGDEYGQGDVASNGNRFMEIGNIVFTQFERSGPAPGKGTLTPLPAKNIDFGGGFERLVMVLEGARTTLDTSLFMPVRERLREQREELFTAVPVSDTGLYGALIVGLKARVANQVDYAPVAGVALTGQFWSDARAVLDAVSETAADLELVCDRSWQHQSLRLIRGHKGVNRPSSAYDATVDFEIREKRIADHIRAITFAMADGIVPKNDGAGYVIRRILRRAFRDGTALGFNGPFLHKLVPVIVEHYGDAYPELQRNTNAVIATIQQEEQQFSTTLERGLQLLAGLIREHKTRDDKTLDGKKAFDLYQSQGLPREVVQDELAAVGMVLDLHAYVQAEEEHRKRSKGDKDVVVFEKGWFQDVKAKHTPTEFLGYETCEAGAKVIAIVRDGQMFDILEAGDTATVILDRTPFYGESGGQVGDRGSIHIGEGVFEVLDTLKRDDYFMHEGKLLHGKLRVGDIVTARVDQQRRDRIRANHSATHLMHAALRRVLGEHVVQRGSEVGPERLRFDFSHPKALTFEERQEIERLVNQQVQANAEVGTAVMAPEAAQKAGAMALFGEKYGDKVRVLSMGVAGFSKELCGGTHVARTGDIGYFRIVSEGSSAAGIRRIEAITGQDAYALAADDARLLAQLQAATKAQPGKVLEKVESLVKEVKDLKGKAKKGGGAGTAAPDEVRKSAETVEGVTIYACEVAGAEAPELLTIKDSLVQDGAPSAVLLGSRGEGRAVLLLAFTKDLVGRGLHAGKLIGEISRLVDGKGGGKPDTAQAGGKNPEGLTQALEAGRKRIREALQS
ncbi:MAG: alanine--tRNA ligase [Planctomycetes bacterium]|nr:alanine--tRNA ligase [Planctomycetota bacterium]